MRNLILLVIALFISPTGADPLNECEIVQQSYFWIVDQHNGAPPSHLFPDLNSALGERNQLVASGACKLPAQVPECFLLAKFGYFYVSQGLTQETGQLVATSLEGAQAIRQSLLQSGSCALPTRLPQCTIRPELSFTVIMQGEHDTGTGYASEASALDFIKTLIRFGACE